MNGRFDRGWAMAWLVALFVLLSPVSIMATSTGQKLQNAQHEKSKAENQLDKTQETVKKLQGDRASLQTYLDELNKTLDEANQKLIEINTIREKKEADIAKAEQDVANLEAMQKRRYEEMKQRIKFMYERGSESYLTFFFSARSFSDLINKADYVEMINKYDRDMLAEYKKTENAIREKKEKLEEDEKALAVLEEDAADCVSKIFAERTVASDNLTKYMAQIREQEKQAMEYERQIAEAESDIATLTEQYKKELAISLEAQALVSRDLSDVIFSAGDIDLMAAIIECEAGGESYTGKVSVGAVVLNRVRSPRFPDTVFEVIMQNRQFSPVGSGRFALVLARGANEACYQAAADAMAGASPVGNCLFFRTPIPGLTGLQIGGHIFY